MQIKISIKILSYNFQQDFTFLFSKVDTPQDNILYNCYHKNTFILVKCCIESSMYIVLNYIFFLKDSLLEPDKDSSLILPIQILVQILAGKQLIYLKSSVYFISWWNLLLGNIIIDTTKTVFFSHLRKQFLVNLFSIF